VPHAVLTGAASAGPALSPSALLGAVASADQLGDLWFVPSAAVLDEDISVRASALYLSCAGTSMISSNLKYTWTLTDSGAGVKLSHSLHVKGQAVY
jgi:hypothetical protein